MTISVRFQNICQATDLVNISASGRWSCKVWWEVTVIQTAAQCVSTMTAGHVLWHVPWWHVWRQNIRWCQKSSVSIHKAGCCLKVNYPSQIHSMIWRSHFNCNFEILILLLFLFQFKKQKFSEHRMCKRQIVIWVQPLQKCWKMVGTCTACMYVFSIAVWELFRGRGFLMFTRYKLIYLSWSDNPQICYCVLCTVFFSICNINF